MRCSFTLAKWKSKQQTARQTIKSCICVIVCKFLGIAYLENLNNVENVCSQAISIDQSVAAVLVHFDQFV